MAAQHIYKLRSDGLTWRSLEDEIVVLDLRTSRYLSVNRSGLVLWPLLESGATEEQLVAALRDRFDVDGDVAEADARDFLSTCAERGLLDDDPAG